MKKRKLLRSEGPNSQSDGWKTIEIYIIYLKAWRTDPD